VFFGDGWITSLIYRWIWGLQDAGLEVGRWTPGMAGGVTGTRSAPG
jgi:hypothetical protein